MEVKAQAAEEVTTVSYSGDAWQPVLHIDPDASVAEALGRLRDAETAAAPILDPMTGQVIGFLSRPPIIVQGVSLGTSWGSAANSATLLPNAPVRLGGMATPLGVYLTDGVSTGGAGFFGLFLTGVFICLMALIGRIITVQIIHLGIHSPYRTLESWVGSGGPTSALREWVVQTISLLPLPFVLVLYRLAPLSGVHAAEHQVAHCVERGKPLQREIVRSMPRVHPRCGTNLVVGFSLFLFVFLSVFFLSQGCDLSIGDGASLATLFAAPIALIYWRRLGGIVQQWFATRPATDLQIMGAIAAAEEVLGRPLSNEPLRFHGMPMRVWRMGLIQVLLGHFVIVFTLILTAHYWYWFGHLFDL